MKTLKLFAKFTVRTKYEVKVQNLISLIRLINLVNIISVILLNRQKTFGTFSAKNESEEKRERCCNNCGLFISLFEQK